MVKANEFRQYIEFYNDKNEFLEEILKKYLNLNARLIAVTLEDIYYYTKNLLGQKKVLDYDDEKYIADRFNKYLLLLILNMKELKTLALKVSYAGQLRIIKSLIPEGQLNLLKKETENKILNDIDIDALRKSITKLKNKVIDKVNISLYTEHTPIELLTNIFSVLPKPKKFKQRSKIKKIMKESNIEEVEFGELESSFGFFDKREFQKALLAYEKQMLSDQIFIGRDAKKVIKIAGEEYFNFEIDQMITDSFVDGVRKGEFEAAKNNGVKDFYWIAIIDSATCEHCCEKRDGMRISEIEKKLKSSWKKDKCQVRVPPAHPNCRCTIVPVLDEEKIKPVNMKREISRWLKDVAMS